MDWLNKKYRHFGDDEIQKSRHLDLQQNEAVQWESEFTKPHRGVLWDKMLLGKSGFKGGIQFTDQGVHSIIYFAYDAYAVTSSLYEATTIVDDVGRGELIISQLVGDDLEKTRGKFGRKAASVLIQFREHKQRYG